jgi:hypothetical protein
MARYALEPRLNVFGRLAVHVGVGAAVVTVVDGAVGGGAVLAGNVGGGAVVAGAVGDGAALVDPTVAGGTGGATVAAVTTDEADIAAALVAVGVASVVDADTAAVGWLRSAAPAGVRAPLWPQAETTPRATSSHADARGGVRLFVEPQIRATAIATSPLRPARLRAQPTPRRVGTTWAARPNRSGRPGGTACREMRPASDAIDDSGSTGTR